MEWKFVVNEKGSKKGCFSCLSSKEWTKEHADLLKNGVVDLVTKELEKAELLDSFLCSLFIGMVCCQTSLICVLRGHVGAMVKED